MNWFDIFNTRETALLVWLALLLPIAIWYRPTRGGLVGIWTTFARATALHKYLLVTLVWVALEVWFLRSVGLWSLAHLKGTVVWALAVPMVATWRLHQLSKKEHYFLKALRDTFALTVLVEFLIDFYPLPLWAEILLVPVAAGLTLFYEVGKTQDGAGIATNLFGWLIAALGIVVLGHATVSAMADIGTLFSFATLVDLIGPIALTLLFLPYLFAVSVYITYANAFRRIKFAIEDPELRRFAHYHAILAFGWRLELIRRWARDMGEGFAESKQGIRRSILEVFEARKRERNPSPVDPADGWSPHIARHFLDGFGLATSDYHRAVSTLDAWWAGSTYLELGGEMLPNNIAYYIDGDAEAAKQLKLTLNVNSLDAGEASNDSLISAATELIGEALAAPLPDAMASAIRTSASECALVNGKQVIVETEPYLSERGYTIRFVIRLPGWTNTATGLLQIDRKQDPARSGSF